MQITKGSIVNGALSLMRISGITRQPTPTDVQDGLQVLDDYIEQLREDGLAINWQSPDIYGNSDPSDVSGITAGMAGALKKLMVVELCGYYGKEVPASVAMTAHAGMRTLEQILVQVPVAVNPPTLPFGSGNEWGYRDRKFYDEPADNVDALYVFNGDILNYSHDFSEWLIDEALASVVWSSEDTGVSIASQSDDGTVASAELTFNKPGGFVVVITATKTNSTDKFTVTKNVIISDPD